MLIISFMATELHMMRYMAFQVTELSFPRGYTWETELSFHKRYNGRNGLVGVTRRLTLLLSLCGYHRKIQTTSLSLAITPIMPILSIKDLL